MTKIDREQQVKFREKLLNLNRPLNPMEQRLADVLTQALLFEAEEKAKQFKNATKLNTET